MSSFIIENFPRWKINIECSFFHTNFTSSLSRSTMGTFVGSKLNLGPPYNESSLSMYPHYESSIVLKVSIYTHVLFSLEFIFKYTLFLLFLLYS